MKDTRRNSPQWHSRIPPFTMFTFDFPPREGGIARMCGEIATRLQILRPIDIVTQRNHARPTLARNPSGFTPTRVIERRPWREIAAWWSLLRLSHNRTVFCGTWYPEGLIALLAGHRHVAMLAHGAELLPAEQPWRRRLWPTLLRWTMEHADVVIANSHFTANMVANLVPRANVVAVPLAVDHERFTPGDRAAARQAFGITDPDTRVICTVARVQDFKGFDVVLRAIAALPDEFRRNVVYFVGGLGPALGDLQELAVALGIENNVRWLGFIPEEQLPDFYRAGDLYCLCTRHQPNVRSVEGFGLVFLEAQACGTPVVGTRTGGIPDAIHEGDGGWLIEQDDVAALAGIIGSLVIDLDAFRAMGAAGRARVERACTWGHYMEQFTTVLGESGDRRWLTRCGNPNS